MKTRLMHVRANVSNLQKAIEWYETMLGFECTGADINERWQYADFECESGATFAIVVEKTGLSTALFNFDVDDVDALWENIKDKVEIVKPIETMPYGTRKFIIKDLDGNELAFCK